MTMTKEELNREDLRSRLTPEQYRITQQKGTEAAFSGEFVDCNCSLNNGTNVSYASDGLKQWFVMIKDQKGRFEDNLNWGDGWGWALYKPDDRGTNVASNYKVDCLGCHVPAKSNDWVYTEAYPTLSKE